MIKQKTQAAYSPERKVEIQELEEALRALNKDIRKRARRDRDSQIEKWVTEDLDIRDQWIGIKRQKLDYKPRPFDKRDKHGNRVTIAEQAEAMADYLEQRQWQKHDDEGALTASISEDRIDMDNMYDVSDISMEELATAISRAKSRKAAGPDDLESELFKMLPESGLDILFKIINNYWKGEPIPDEEMKAYYVIKKVIPNARRITNPYHC